MRAIELDLERLRWFPATFGNRYVLVNIPDYSLHAYDGGKEVLTMRVVVGDEYGHATPVFADTLSQVVFQPYWNVPPSIVKAEILPKVRQDQHYLETHHFEVVRGTRTRSSARHRWTGMMWTRRTWLPGAAAARR